MSNLPNWCDDGALPIPSAAEFLGVARSTVYGLMQDQQLPYVKIRGARRIPRKALVAFLEKNMVGGQALRTERASLPPTV
jgi:excisionase family DNA binding protein